MLLLLACTPSSPVTTEPDPTPDSGAETAPDTDSDTAPSDDSADPIEYIDGAPPAEPGLCEVVLSCEGPIEDEPKIGCEMTVTSDTPLSPTSSSCSPTHPELAGTGEKWLKGGCGWARHGELRRRSLQLRSQLRQQL